MVFKNEIHILNSVYTDPELKTKLYSIEETNDLEDNEINSLSDIYSQTLGILWEDLKKLALCPFFQNLYSLSEDKIFNFYGKPVVELSFYQSELFTYGRFFKSLLNSEVKPPVEVANDPDRLIEWADLKNTSKRVMGESIGGAVSIVGATEEDMKAIAPNAEIIPLYKEAEAAGGTISLQKNMESFMNMFG